MDDKSSTKPVLPKSKQVTEKAEQRELWFKTVVKVLKWKEGKRGKAEISEMITSREWHAYCKETLKINATTKSQATQKLKDTEELIRKNGGFAS